MSPQTPTSPAPIAPIAAAADRPQSMFFRHEFKGGVLLVRPAGPNLGQREAVILNTEVGAIIANLGPRLRTLVLDLSDIQAMASFGLGICIELRNAAHARGSQTVVFGLSDELAALFRLMKVERLYKIVQTQKDLAKALAA